MVDFAGWRMPIRYRSTTEEHHAVRRDTGMFDVSHMLPVDFEGSDCNALLQKLLAGDVTRLKDDGAAQYTLMMNESGGIIDDLIVYRLGDQKYRIVFNAAVAHTDMEWVESWVQKLNCDVSISARRDLNIVAVQGPNAVEKVSNVLGCDSLPDLKSFTALSFRDYFIARTGYTGEDGVEILCSVDLVRDLWRKLEDASVLPCGLGARDTLRLEAGMNLNGQDMTTETTPHESALSWVIHNEPPNRDFVGRAALAHQKEKGVQCKLTGLVLQGGVMRSGFKVSTNSGDGVITSGAFSPTLGYSVALARVPRNASGDCLVSIRGKHKQAKLVRPPFVRKGVQVYQ